MNFKSYSSTWDVDVHCTYLHYQCLWYIQYPDNVVSSVMNSLRKHCGFHSPAIPEMHVNVQKVPK